MSTASPFVLDVSHVLREGIAEPVRQTAPTPVRIGAEMIGVEPGTDVTVAGIVSSLGSGVLVDATITAPLKGECVRCLSTLEKELDVHITAVFAASDDFITGDEAEEGEDEVGQIVDNTVDITQAVIDEAVLSLPFNPTCINLGVDCHETDSSVPEPDGVSGEEERIDPRWAGLAEKFKEN